MNSTVHLINADWNSVNVDVRQGDNGDVNQNNNLGTRNLARNQEWVIQTEQNIQYRWDRDPDNPNGTYTDWVNIPIYPDQPQDIPQHIGSAG
jgi:hypothetical protein